jgi:hypothetical protein
MMGAITIFGGKKKKKVSYLILLDYGLLTKSLGARCTFEEVPEKTKCPKMNVNFLNNQIRMNHLT